MGLLHLAGVVAVFGLEVISETELGLLSGDGFLETFSYPPHPARGPQHCQRPLSGWSSCRSLAGHSVGMSFAGKVTAHNWRGCGVVTKQGMKVSAFKLQLGYVLNYVPHPQNPC